MCPAGGGRADSAAGELISWFELTHQPLLCRHGDSRTPGVVSGGAMLEQRAAASVMSPLCDVTTVGLPLQELVDAFRVLLVHLFLFLQVVRMQLPRWLLRACLGLLYITEVWTATFKLALIGPWSCDPMFSRAIPTAAANLALSRLRRDSSLSRGYHYDIKLLEEDCSASKGSSHTLT